MTSDGLLTVTQSLLLAGIGPCLFAAIYLWFSDRSWRMLLLPSAYFLWLGASFTLPIALRFAAVDAQGWRWAILAMESSVPVFNVLLILQFLRARPPVWQAYLLFLLPLVGGSTLFYADALDTGVCTAANPCITTAVRELYGIFSAGMVYLLLIVLLPRLIAASRQISAQKRLRYWLVIALIGFDLARAAIALLALAGMAAPSIESLATTIIQLAFVYLASTLVFRIYGDDASIAPVIQLRTATSDDDAALAARIRVYMEAQRPYLEMGFNRAQLAKALGTNETQLSRAINTRFGETFSTFANRYRVEAAMQRLREETTPITVIAFETGFNSIASFNRVFKIYVSVSPSAYRASPVGTSPFELAGDVAVASAGP